MSSAAEERAMVARLSAAQREKLRPHRDLINATTPCPVCNGEGRVYRMTPAYEAISQQAGATFGWAGPTHEWRTCHPCRGAGLLYLPALLDVADALERLLDEFDYWTSEPRPAIDGGTVRLHKFGEVQPEMERKYEQARATLARLRENQP